jgi:hypothetical protein
MAVTEKYRQDKGLRPVEAIGKREVAPLFPTMGDVTGDGFKT